MGDGGMCHYCRRYKCICDYLENLEAGELGNFMYGVRMPGAKCFIAFVYRDDAMGYLKENEELFDSSVYEFCAIKSAEIRKDTEGE